MRHVSVLLISSLALAACSLVAAAPAGGNAPGAGDKYEAGTPLPRNLVNMEARYEKLLEYVDQLEKDLADGTLNSSEKIHSARISWLTWFADMTRGGSPPCPACKNHARYKELRDGAAAINDRFAKVELAVAKCTYGYRMSNGDLLALTLTWSEDEFKDIREKALPPKYMQKEHCWLDDKDGKAGKSGSWVY